MPEVLADTVYAETRTADMAEKYQLTEEQFAQVFALNLEYASKLQFDPSIMGERNQGERKDPRSMSDAERQEFSTRVVADAGTFAMEKAPDSSVMAPRVELP